MGRTMRHIWSALLVVASAWSGAAAQDRPADQRIADIPKQLHAATPCVSDAAEYHQVNPWVLKAILKVESGFKPGSINRNANGTVDVGMAQINSIHFATLKRWGIEPGHLLDGCVATYVAAWHLAKQIRLHGNTWFGIAAYHSTTRCQNDRYSGLIWNTLTDWKVVPGPKVRVSTLAQCGYFPPGPQRAQRAPSSNAAPVVAFDAN